MITGDIALERQKVIALKFSFPTGKFHATPWGRQVNEGAIEWPPSSWRILRALISVWHNKFPDVPREDFEPIIDALTDPPSFRLPTGLSQGHTRHYMPTNSNPAKVFDTFLVIPRDESVVACWPNAHLGEQQRQLLQQIVSSLGYLGRAESWVAAELLDEFSETPNSVPLNGSEITDDQSLERLLVPNLPEEFETWRSQFLAETEAAVLAEKRTKAETKGKDATKVTLNPKDKQKVADQIPNSLFDALHAETNALRKSGWNRPPGSRWVEYVRPSDTTTDRPATRAKQQTTLPTVARYAVSGKVIPQLTQAMRIAERARKVVMGCSKRTNPDDNAAGVFSGKSLDGSPLQASHSHAHFLCEANDVTGKITHLTIYAPRGFQEHDEQALSRFTRTWGDGGHDLQFVLLGIGQPSDFGGENTKIGQSPILAKSTTWISRTPFVPSRHLKIKGADRSDPGLHQAAMLRELETAVRFELQQRRSPGQADITFADLVQEIEPILIDNHGTMLGNQTPWLKFVRQRTQSKSKPADSRGYGFQLQFTEAVSGPISLGYGSHFGLGLFIPTT